MTETHHILYNPLAGGGCGTAEAQKLNTLLAQKALRFYDMTEIRDYRTFFAQIPAEEPVVICGGDGTLNRFINDSAGLRIPNEILYYATGSGNDFLHDLGGKKGDAPIPVTKYLQNLPEIIVKQRRCRFLNGIGYGIDGYCCEVGDRQREASSKPVNYTAIAIKGLLFHYHPTNAVITVDGIRHTYKGVWLAPTMNGRFYGGGMMPAPCQDRLNPEGTVSVVVMYGSGKLKTLAVFPSIFSGGHVAHTEMVEVLTGHEISVAFDRPTALQIDGETISGVTEYSVTSPLRAAAASAATIA